MSMAPAAANGKTAEAGVSGERAIPTLFPDERLKQI